MHKNYSLPRRLSPKTLNNITKYEFKEKIATKYPKKPQKVRQNKYVHNH